MSDFVKSKNRLSLSPGASLRIAREMMGWSQNTLSEKSGIPQSTISGIEANRISLGVERAKKLAISLQIHPSVLLFVRFHRFDHPNFTKFDHPLRWRADRRDAG